MYISTYAIQPLFHDPNRLSVFLSLSLSLSPSLLLSFVNEKYRQTTTAVMTSNYSSNIESHEQRCHYY